MGLHSWCSDIIYGLILRWCIYDAYMVIFIRIRRSTKLEYTTSLLDDESLICCCCHMHKDHIIQLWCRIPIILGAHRKPWQKILSSRYIVLDTWMITQSWLDKWWWWVLTYMLIGWYLHILIKADIPKWWYMDDRVDKMAMVFYT